MNAHRVIRLVVVTCSLALPFGGVPAGIAKDGDHGAAAKERFDFEKLPGKNGPTYSAKGLDVAAILQKHGLKLLQGRQDFIAGRGVDLRYAYTRQPAAPAADGARAKADAPAKPVPYDDFFMHVGATPRDAQEMLFALELGDRRSMVITDYLDGFERSDGVGYFCIVRKKNSKVQSLLFARGNMAFSLHGLGDADVMETLMAAAKDIDAAVQKQPVMTEKDWAGIPTAQVAAPKLGLFEVGKEVAIPVTVKPPLAEGQSVVTACDSDGSSGSYDPATGVVSWNPTQPGQYHLGIGVYDKALRMIRWTMVEVEVKAGPAK